VISFRVLKKEISKADAMNLTQPPPGLKKQN
jgi:hypothetical protein